MKNLKKILFIHINKTGGTSVEKALNIPPNHITALEKIKEIGQQRWDESFSFSIVRNPWDKVVSHYHYRVKTNQTYLKTNPIEFKAWVKLAYRDKNIFYYDNPEMFMPQIDWISNCEGKVLVNYICKFENLQTDFEKVCQLAAIPIIQLPHLQKSERKKDYKGYYDEETRLIIEKCFQKDIQKLGYKF